MRTIDWPTPLTQTYVNVDVPGRTVMIDDDHQSVGQYSAQVGPTGARELAAAHRAVAEALDAAADLLDNRPQVVATAGTPPIATQG